MTTMTKQRGVTMVELLATSSIVATLATGAATGMTGFVQQQRLTNTSNDLLLAVKATRGHAVARRDIVTLAPRDGANWASGWRIFVDRDADGAFDGDETVLQESAAAPHGVQITPHFGVAYAGKYLSYGALGVLRRPGSEGLVLGRLVVSNERGARALCFSAPTLRVVKGATCG
jgi:type IV fimbrial biogenesis protein FimT